MNFNYRIMIDEILQIVKEEKDILHKTKNKEEYVDWNCLARELPSFIE
jgi:hypothetical protein